MVLSTPSPAGRNPADIASCAHAGTDGVRAPERNASVDKGRLFFCRRMLKLMRLGHVRIMGPGDEFADPKTQNFNL